MKFLLETHQNPYKQCDLHIGVSDCFTDLNYLCFQYNSTEKTILLFERNRQDTCNYMFDQRKAASFMCDIRSYMSNPY